MKRFAAFALTIALAATGPATSEASTAGSAYITLLLPMVSGSTMALFFNQTGTRSTPPSCATYPSRWVIDTSTAGGQAMAAVVLTAYAMNKQIQITGLGTCSVWPDTETINYIQVQD